YVVYTTTIDFCQDKIKRGKSLGSAPLLYSAHGSATSKTPTYPMTIGTDLNLTWNLGIRRFVRPLLPTEER
ncbi:hypothetical protein K8R42_01015, partial [bacterium]|nr:hypothetical protein [bacterium]